ncbi:hypothetical protein SUDANB13_01077 [Streptomyces sp. enrichment culture]
MDTHPRLGLVSARPLVGPAGAPDPLNDVLAASPLGPAKDLPGTQVLGFLACACVVRREAYLEAGGFHPLLFFGSDGPARQGRPDAGEVAGLLAPAA